MNSLRNILKIAIYPQPLADMAWVSHQRFKWSIDLTCVHRRNIFIRESRGKVRKPGDLPGSGKLLISGATSLFDFRPKRVPMVTMPVSSPDRGVCAMVEVFAAVAVAVAVLMPWGQHIPHVPQQKCTIVMVGIALKTSQNVTWSLLGYTWRRTKTLETLPGC